VQTIKVIQVSYVYPGHNGKIRETKEVGLRKKKKKTQNKSSHEGSPHCFSASFSLSLSLPTCLEKYTGLTAERREPPLFLSSCLSLCSQTQKAIQHSGTSLFLYLSLFIYLFYFFYIFLVLLFYGHHFFFAT
jgi:hypothetical protein